MKKELHTTHGTPNKTGDLHAKQLIENNDIFADIVNAFMFDGKRIVKEEELESVLPETEYLKEEQNQISSLRRDVLKKWRSGKTLICIIGIEDQMEIDKDMIFRSYGYDGSSYAAQVRSGNKERYPVITLVLYYGIPEWKEPITLYEALNIPEELKPYISDYRMNLIDLRRLDEETVKKLRTEFGAIVELMIDPAKRDNRIEIKHKEVTRDLMASLGIANISDAVLLNTKEPVTMKRLLTENEREKFTAGEAKGKAEGRAEGIAEGKAEDVQKLMKKQNMTAAQAMALLEIPEEEQELILNHLSRLA